METVSTSFSAAADDLAAWIRDALDLPGTAQPAGCVADAAQIAVSPLHLSEPSQHQTPQGVVRAARAHLCVSFGPDLPGGGAAAYDTVFFAVMHSAGVALSDHVPDSNHWCRAAGLSLMLERGVNKPLAAQDTRPVSEPLIFDIHDKTRLTAAKGS